MKPVFDYLVFTGEADTCAFFINGKHVANCDNDCIDADMLQRIAEACGTTINIQEIVCEDSEVNFEDYARLIDQDESIPEWAEKRSNGNYMEPGAQLATKDGRFIGNSFVDHIEQHDELGCIAVVVTDSGNSARMSRQELEDAFYPPAFTVRLGEARAKPKKTNIAHWNSTVYGGDVEDAEKTFVCEVLDLTETHGQISVDIAPAEGDIDYGIFTMFEISRLDGQEYLPSVHISIDGTENSITVFQRRDELIVRPGNAETEVQRTELSDGSEVIVIR